MIQINDNMELWYKVNDSIYCFIVTKTRKHFYDK